MSNFYENMRICPIDIFVCQPGDGEGDPNTAAAKHVWGDNQHWTFINDVKGLVNHVKKRCLPINYIRILRIGGHGTASSFRVGHTLIHQGSLANVETDLAEIKPYLKPDKSLVVLDHCNVGKSEFLLKEFSRILGGVMVMGPLDEQYNNDGAPALEGTARVCNSKLCMIEQNSNDEPKKILRSLSEMMIVLGF